MHNSPVVAPVPLLLAPEVSSSAKLIWLMLRAGTRGPAQLETRTGLSRKTVLKGLADLTAHGWHRAGAINREPHSATVDIPAVLLTVSGVSTQGKLLYGHLQLLPGFTHPRGHFTYAQLHALTGAHPETLRRSTAELLHTGWLEIAQESRKAPVGFRLTHPGSAERALVRERLEGIQHLGERLMREYLSVLVDSTNFQDNATPGFLVNPFTDAHLELDRYYPEHKVGFEFNGPQHDHATDLFPEETVARQKGRDLIKEALCHRAGVTLIIIHPQDLTLNAVQAALPKALPRRNLTGHEPLLDLLASESDRYRRIARSHGWLTQ